MNGNAEDLSAAEMEREVENTRAEVVRTIEALEDKLSPDYLIDRTVTRIRESSLPGDLATFGRNLGQGMRDNPMPLLLMGIGIGWMMISSNRRDSASHYGWPEDDGLEAAEGVPAYETYPEDTYSSTAPGGGPGRDGDGALRKASAAASGVAGAASRGAHEIAEQGSRIGSAVGGASRSAARSVQHGVRSAAHRVSSGAHRAVAGAQRVSSGAHRLSESARHASESVSVSARQASRAAVNALHEHPLAIGLLGAALGAAVSTLLPGTKTEDEWMGDASDDVKHRAVSAAREAATGVREAATASVEAAKKEARSQGLTAENAAKQASDLRTKVGKVEDAALHAAEREIRGRAPGSGSKPENPGTGERTEGEDPGRRPAAPPASSRPGN